MLQVTIFCDKFHGNFFVEKNHEPCRKFFIKGGGVPRVCEGSHYTPFVLLYHADYVFVKELNFYFNHFCGGVQSVSSPNH